MRKNLQILKSIENRILCALIIIAVIPLLVSFIINNFIISQSILNLEKENLHSLGNQANTIIEEKLNELGTIARDYSIWDDAYNKLEENNSQWFKENFSDWIPSNFNLDFSVVINNNKQIIDESGLKNNDISQLLQDESISNMLKAPFVTDKANYPRGIVMYNGDPYLFYASPILKTYYKGEQKGLLIIGKKISSSYISSLGKRLEQKIFMTFGDKIISSDDLHDNINDYIKVSDTNNTSDDVKFWGNELIGSIYIDNIPNTCQAKLTVIMKRDTFISTKKMLDITSSSVIWLALLAILAAVLILRKYTTKPLKNFENEIYEMSQNNVISYVTTEGPREIEKLTEAFNKMVNKLNEKTIENQNLKSELQYDKLRGEFLTNISHEFKTPINVIFSALQLTELYVRNDPDSKLSKNLSKNIYIMRQNCYRLLRMVNNLIDLTRIGSNTYRLDFVNFEIISLIEDITLSVSDYTKSKGLFIGFDTDVEEKVIACDPDQIERIILNLLSNAIKFTEPGGEIWVTVQDKKDMLLISVKDNGLGIPEDHHKLIFERFRQVDSSLTRNHEGSGIGLSLVKSLVEMHEGSIAVKSEPGKGSEFIIELPAIIVPKTAITENKNNFTSHNKVERINIEFSDIYSH
ncbi:GHKL domain-containing protein [Clostridium sp. YIM B02515]|uniref:histidine kinase n=1 Tax=Clostridium rhizosphaerae TaxID=2803861 RepID=A0ABS1T507_9CLOT|nr:ATP-binding protein [Clostridium rhizosphaerae]MBL4934405.1 GHKL domain-containing protein [Clostridium rhizosphaerae]